MLPFKSLNSSASFNMLLASNRVSKSFQIDIRKRPFRVVLLAGPNHLAILRSLLKMIFNNIYPVAPINVLLQMSATLAFSKMISPKSNSNDTVHFPSVFPTLLHRLFNISLMVLQTCLYRPAPTVAIILQCSSSLTLIPSCLLAIIFILLVTFLKMIWM